MPPPSPDTGTPSHLVLMQYGYAGNFEEAALEDPRTMMEPRIGRVGGWHRPCQCSLVLQTAQSCRTGADLTLHWQSVTNRNYYLQRCTNLIGNPNFVTLATDIAGQAGTTPSPISMPRPLAACFTG